MDAIEAPDRLILDIDPAEDVAWTEVVQAARRLRDLMRGLGLTGFVRTTGGKGLHVVFPLRGKLDWETLRAFAAAVVRELAATFPDEYVATMSKRAREGRIFIDHFRNARGATAVASYSSRSRAGAPIAAPLAWKELTPQLDRRVLDVQQCPHCLQGYAHHEGTFCTCCDRPVCRHCLAHDAEGALCPVCLRTGRSVA